jgi:hypothetical protein
MYMMHMMLAKPIVIPQNHIVSKEKTEGVATSISYISYASYSNNEVEAFFYDNPSLPYKPLPPHSLELKSLLSYNSDES